MSNLTYPLQFPLCDLLICEFDETPTVCKESSIGTVVPFQKPRRSSNVLALPTPTPRVAATTARRITRVVNYCWKKVVSRKPYGFRPHPAKAPNWIICGVKETLECGHELDKGFIDGVETLTASKRNCHECSGWFGGLKLPAKPVRSAAPEIKKKAAAGYGYWPVAFASLLVVGLALYIHSLTTVGYTYVAPENSFRVLAKFNDYYFLMQRVENGRPQMPWTFHFCHHDLAPQFEAGMSLIWFSYEDRGTCASIAPPTRGYVIDRGADHWPKLASNCRRNGEAAPICEGEPRWE